MTAAAIQHRRHSELHRCWILVAACQKRVICSKSQQTHPFCLLHSVITSQPWVATLPACFTALYYSAKIDRTIQITVCHRPFGQVCRIFVSTTSRLRYHKMQVPGYHHHFHY